LTAGFFAAIQEPPLAARQTLRNGQLRKSIPNKGRDYTDADPAVQGQENTDFSSALPNPSDHAPASIVNPETESGLSMRDDNGSGLPDDFWGCGRRSDSVHYGAKSSSTEFIPTDQGSVIDARHSSPVTIWAPGRSMTHLWAHAPADAFPDATPTQERDAS
jgi:hypothetical protein